MARLDLFERIGQRLSHTKPAIRLNLLRIVRSICDACDEQGALLIKFGLLDAIRELEINDTAVLVRNMAQELVKSCEESEDLLSNASTASAGPSGGKRRTTLRRTSTNTTPPHLLERQMSTPASPRPSIGWDVGQNKDRDSIVYYDRPDRAVQTPRRGRTGIGITGMPSYGIRPTSRDGLSGRSANGIHSPVQPSSPAFNLPSSRASVNIAGNTSHDTLGSRSRLPRTTTTTSAARAPRQQPLRAEPNLSNLQENSLSRSSGMAASRANRDKLHLQNGRDGRQGDVEAANTRKVPRRQTSGEVGRWS